MRNLSLMLTGLLLVSRCGQLLAVPVTDGLLLWLDATDGATLFQDDGLTIPASPGDPIGGWFDKSGNDFHAYQVDPAFQPVWESDVMNGQPALRFSGFQSDGMAIDEGLYLERPYTVFIVNQYWDAANRGRTLQGLDFNWLHGMWGRRIASYAEGFIGPTAPSPLNAQAPVNVPVVADTTGDLDESTFFANGRDYTVDFTPVGIPGRLGLMSEGAFPAEVSDADVSEIVIYDRVLSSSEMTDVRNFLYSKYDVTLFDDSPQNNALQGSIGVFTGGDPDDGLDFEGTFAYAINVGGPGGIVVGDAEFTDGSRAGMQGGSSPGAMISQANEINSWFIGEFGDSENDNNLETVMQSIRWNDFLTHGALDVDLEVEAGIPYRLQLLFAEQCCNRGFDVSVEGERVVEALNVQVVQEGINNTSQAVFYTLDLVAPDDELNISLHGVDINATDNNPILEALTLEIAPNGLLTGDYNNNGQLDVGDLNLQADAIAGGQDPPEFDLTNDGLVNFDDRKEWVEVLKNTWIGDANLDDEFNSSDMVEVFVQGKYETGETVTWAEGDWDGNTKFQSGDMVAAFVGGGYEKGKRPQPAVSAVPEPSAMLLSLVALAALAAIRRRVEC